MGKRNFTETWIKNLRPHEVRRDFTEANRPGFMLRVWPTGKKTFVYRYLWNGQSRIMTLGQWPALTLEQAHDDHTAARKLFQRGIDPIEDREREVKARSVQEQHEKAVTGITTRNVVAEWGWHWARIKRKRPREAVRLARVYLAKPWKGRPVAELTKRDAVLLLDRLVAKGSNVMARRVRSLGLQVFTFAVARDLVTVNPFVGTLPPGDDEQPRERKLDAQEIRTFWRALDGAGIEMSKPVRLALKLILATGQRPGEVAGATWSEIDTGNCVWTIPAARSKNDRTHEVPLSDLALEIIEQLRPLAKGRPHLLPSVQSKLKRDESLSQRALSRALRNNFDDDEKLFGLEPFTPHDLRRTCASMMTTLGIARLHVSKVLNHTDQDITGKVYDLNQYAAEKRVALQTWADGLRAIIAGKKPKAAAQAGASASP